MKNKFLSEYFPSSCSCFIGNCVAISMGTRQRSPASIRTERALHALFFHRQHINKKQEKGGKGNMKLDLTTANWDDIQEWCEEINRQNEEAYAVPNGKRNVEKYCNYCQAILYLHELFPKAKIIAHNPSVSRDSHTIEVRTKTEITDLNKQETQQLREIIGYVDTFNAGTTFKGEQVILCFTTLDMYTAD
jgi:hypothetical protein